MRSMSETTVRHALLTLVAGAGLLIVGAAAAEDCDHIAPREETLDVSGVELIEIDASAGYLRVVGEDRSSELRIRGEACASSERLLEDVQLVVRRYGSRIRVVAEIPDSLWGNSTARLDLNIDLPSNIPLEIDDGSGAMEVRHVASVVIDDGSGAIEIEDVRGDLRIDDGSGAIEVSEVSGEVRIDDGSGEIDLRKVGSVLIDDDGSGEIEIVGVYGDVMVRSDGSGSISVREVDGDFTVRRDGSGDIQHDAVAGLVNVPDDD